VLVVGVNLHGLGTPVLVPDDADVEVLPRARLLSFGPPVFVVVVVIHLPPPFKVFANVPC